MAEDYLQGDVEYRAAHRCLRGVTGKQNAHHEQQPGNSFAIAALGASQKALEAALFDEPYDARSIDPEIEDRDVDVDEWDAYYHAAESYACAEECTDEEEMRRRIEFWSWNLDKAVPAA